MTESKGVFLLIHGLNLKPEMMAAIQSQIHMMGYDVIVPALSCHQLGADNLHAQHTITADQWIKEFKAHYEKAERHANGTVNIAAYSLGCAVALRYLIEYKPSTIGKLILLEPATRLSTKIEFLLWLSKWLKFNPKMGIPSANNPNYRVENSTSISTYRALKELGISGLDSVDRAYLRKVEALVIMEKKTEPISIKRIMEDFSGLGWTMEIVLNTKRNNVHPIFKWVKPTFHHLIIDDRVTSESCWETICELIRGHIS